MPTFGNKSKENLLTCHEKLQLVCWEAIAIMDFTVLEGHRDQEKQALMFNEGKSKTKWPRSKHNRLPSHAVDIAPYPIDWGDRERFYMLAGIMFGIAFKHGIKLRWGGDWDGDMDFKDQSFNDLPHFELIEEY